MWEMSGPRSFDVFQRGDENLVLKAIPQGVKEQGQEVGRIGVIPSFEKLNARP